MSPRVVIEEEQPSRVRITRADGARVEFDGPFVRSDSIHNGADCERVFTSDGRAVCPDAAPAVALNDVVGLDVGHTAGVLTGLAVVGGVVAVAALLLVIGCATNDSDSYC